MKIIKQRQYFSSLMAKMYHNCDQAKKKKKKKKDLKENP